MIRRESASNHDRMLGNQNVLDKIACTRILRSAASDTQECSVLSRDGLVVQSRIVQNMVDNALRSDQHNRLNLSHNLPKIIYNLTKLCLYWISRSLLSYSQRCCGCVAFSSPGASTLIVSSGLIRGVMKKINSAVLLAVFVFRGRDLALGALIVVLLGLASGLLPALQARRLAIADALRRTAA